MPRLSKRKPKYDPTGQAVQPRELSPALRRFAEEYCISLDPKQAASAAGYPRPSCGYQLLGDPRVADLIARIRNRRATRLELSQDHVLRCWDAARQVDYNEFVELRVTCCRYCWGFDHRRQMTLAEIDERRDAHIRAQLRLPPDARREFDDAQFETWDRSREPCRGPAWWVAQGEPAERVEADHDCPNCCGNGEPLVVFKDTRHLSQGARYVYQGVEVGRDGQIKYNLRGRKDFDEMVARHLGMFPSEGRRSRDPVEMSDDELDAVLSAHGVTVEVEFETVEGQLLEEETADVDQDRAHGE